MYPMISGTRCSKQDLANAVGLVPTSHAAIQLNNDLVHAFARLSL